MILLPHFLFSFSGLEISYLILFWGSKHTQTTSCYPLSRYPLTSAAALICYKNRELVISGKFSEIGQHDKM